MTMLRQPDVQVEEVTESASFWAESCLAMIEQTTGLRSSYASYPAPEINQNSFQDHGSLELPAHTAPDGRNNWRDLLNERHAHFTKDFQLSEFGIFNATCDLPMTFRDQHRFLDGIYNSYPDPTLITAKDMSEVARKVGLLMEEVFAWFKDEKLRRAKLLANKLGEAQVSSCQLPPSPKSTRASEGPSAASLSYSSTSPGTTSQPLDAFPRCQPPTEDAKLLGPPKSKRGRPAKSHIKTELDLPSPDAKRRKISMKYPCPDCGNFVASERYAEHINRKHFPENIWECPKTNQQTGKPCSSNPHYRPSYRLDNFATHLKGEHDCSASEIVELKKTCKFEVLDFFHKICGFCDKTLESRNESIEHIKNHFRHTSQEPNPPTDLGVSLWKEKCGSEHKLQLGVHYRRSQASKPNLMNIDHDYDRDGREAIMKNPMKVVRTIQTTTAQTFNLKTPPMSVEMTKVDILVKVFRIVKATATKTLNRTMVIIIMVMTIMRINNLVTLFGQFKLSQQR
ncbi:hypothetical protein B0O99DRAFT_688125 [Bisporella sp. PMI_857]|nr:hypothetical protein B0O99DRAFT_688125 [Bisporella sp. PMI_857]